MTTHVAEAPQTHIKSEVVAASPTLKIVRLTIPGGESLPPHAAKGHVVIAVIRGEGRINVAGRDLAAEPGRVIQLGVGEQHSVYADQRLELLVIQGA